MENFGNKNQILKKKSNFIMIKFAAKFTHFYPYLSGSLFFAGKLTSKYIYQGATQTSIMVVEVEH